MPVLLHNSLIERIHIFQLLIRSIPMPINLKLNPTRRSHYRHHKLLTHEMVIDRHSCIQIKEDDRSSELVVFLVLVDNDVFRPTFGRLDTVLREV